MVKSAPWDTDESSAKDTGCCNEVKNDHEISTGESWVEQTHGSLAADQLQLEPEQLEELIHAAVMEGVLKSWNELDRATDGE